MTWNPSDRHGLRLLLAPFSLTETVTPDAPIAFAGESVSAGQPAEPTYTFYSYRLTYRYRFHDGGITTAWVGFTGKIRDAVIRAGTLARSSQPQMPGAEAMAAKSILILVIAATTTSEEVPGDEVHDNPGVCSHRYQRTGPGRRRR